MTPDLALHVHCGACGSAPPIRITAAERDLHRSLPADTICATYACQTGTGPNGGRCGNLVAVTAESYVRAFVAPSRPLRVRLTGDGSRVLRSGRSIRSRGIQP